MRSRKGLCPGRKDFYPHVAKFMPVPVAAASGAGLLGLLLLQRYRKSRKTLV